MRFFILILSVALVHSASIGNHFTPQDIQELKEYHDAIKEEYEAEPAGPLKDALRDGLIGIDAIILVPDATNIEATRTAEGSIESTIKIGSETIATYTIDDQGKLIDIEGVPLKEPITLSEKEFEALGDLADSADKK